MPLSDLFTNMNIYKMTLLCVYTWPLKTAAAVMAAIIKAPAIYFSISSLHVVYVGHVIDGLEYIRTGQTSITLSPVSNNCSEKPTAAAFYERYLLPLLTLVLCVSISCFSPRSFNLPQTLSDNDAAYSIIRVNTV